ncbi:MAG TPA: amino acid adenylation domain-containing protein [Ruminiclostridium sp.]|nr:amino acid adenylation domain-containing protein [Ruminiclostridium sp.]
MSGFKKENVMDMYFLSPMQQGMLYHYLLDPGKKEYFQQLSFDVKGELDLGLFELSFNKLVERHEILRTSFAYEKTKRPVQVVLKERTCNIQFEDFSSCREAAERAARLEEYMERDREKGFDLSKGPLIRLSVLRIDQEEYKVIISFHHIIMDGWCIGVFLEEIFEIYKSVKAGIIPNLPAAVPYSKYIQWLEKQDSDAASEYWKDTLEGYEQLAALPQNSVSVAEESCGQQEVHFTVGRELLKRMEYMAGSKNVTVNTVLQTVWGILLQKYNNTDDAVFGTVISGRTPQIPGVERMLGLLINTIPVRIKSVKQESFSGLIQRIQQNLLECEKYGYYPLYEIQSGLDSKQGLLNHLFIFENYPLSKYTEGLGKDQGLVVSNMKLWEKTNYDFNIEIIPGDGLDLKISYNPAVYSSSIITSIYNHMLQILKAVTEDPEVLLGEIDILPPCERERLLVDFNSTKTEYTRDRTISELFEEQAGKTPDEKALILGTRFMTYHELDEKSNRLAKRLQEKGVGRDVIVGLLTTRSMEMLVGIIGILKAGGAYLPIDPEYPRDRVLYMLEDSKAGILLTEGNLAGELGFRGEIIDLQSEEAYSKETGNVNAGSTPDSLAYVIYTSGSTGRPKGVMLEHRSVINFIKGITDIIDFSNGKTIICITTLSFDIFVLETLLPLTKGLRVVIADERQQMEPEALRELIVENHADMLQTTPSRMQMILNGAENLDFIGSLKEIMLGGEAFPGTLLTELKKHTRARIYNMYGPTETTVWSTVKELTQETHVSIGKPIANTQIYILDKNTRPQPVGITGELYIGGDGLARGYLNSPELTREKFVPSPFGAGVKIYRTGDLGRWLPDGNIECLGRVDNQVKVRGYRIETGEIEHHLLQHEAIKEAAVVADRDKHNMNCLYAYIVTVKDVPAAEIRSYLLERLPEYMVPSAFVKLDRLPVTPNGKLDRKSLPKPDIALLNTDEYEKPVNELEEKLAAIWSEILGIDKVGTKSRFIELGGHSILIMSAIARINKELGVQVSLKEFMGNDTVKALSCLIQGKQDKVTNCTRNTGTGSHKDSNDPFPLTDVQTAYLLGRDTQFELGGVSTHGYVEIRTALDIQKLERSLGKVIRRHPMLRSIILENGSQKILDEIPEYRIAVEDISSLERAAQEKILIQERERMSDRIFNTEQWPLFEFKAVRTAEDTQYLYIGIDMLIADASSMQILVDELMYFYHHPDEELPELTYTFRDYILDYQQLKKSESYSVDKDYWLGKLNDFPQAPSLPLKVNPSDVNKAHNKRRSFFVDSIKWNRLKRTAQRENLTIPALLCTAYAEILADWSNQPHMAVNLTVFNRYPFHEEVNKLIGDFTSVLVLDIHLKEGTDLLEQAKDVQDTLFDALEHRLYDGIEFIRDITRQNQMGMKAVMPVVFTCSLLGEKKTGFELLGEIENSLTQTSQVYLDNQVVETTEGAYIYWDYAEELFSENVISEMFEQYTGLLVGLASESIEKQQALRQASARMEKYNDTYEELEKNTLHGLFAEQAERTPDNIAVVFESESFTYRELNTKSNQIANYLTQNGITPNELVGVSAKRCTGTIANILGILKAGAAYVPVDPEYPEERRNYILTNSKCRLFLEPDLFEKENLLKFPEKYTARDNPGSVAYVIYTSGSTGKPKGVVITHAAAVNTIIDINRKFNVNNKDRILGLSSMCFDLSVYDIFGALSTGAMLVMIPDQRDAGNLIEVMSEKGITIWNSVPAIMDMLVDTMTFRGIQGVNKALRLVLLSGDWIPMSLPGAVKGRFPKAEVISLGGATEGSIWSIYYPIGEINKNWKSIPYGYPLANQKMYVLNYKKEICPAGVQGELYIGGAGVAECYCNDPEKTAGAFIQHPSLGYLYRTGDYGVFREEGYIEFLGRKDHQIKIRGYRIEMGEIENCLLKHKDIKNAVIVDREDSNGKKYLCAYIVSGQTFTVSAVREFLSRELPDYMIPTHVVQVEKIPLSSNGKVDRKSLPEPADNGGTMAGYTAPGNETEQKVARIWEGLLGVEAIGIYDAFFDVGGDSLKAIKLAERINQEFKTNLKVQDLFQYTTVSSIAALLSGKSEADTKHEIKKFNLN